MGVEQELRVLLSSSDTVVALESIYETTIRRILQELAYGVSRGSAARNRELLSRITALVRELDPSRMGQVRKWIQETIPQAFILGDDQATRQLRNELGDLAGGGEGVVTGFTVSSNETMRAIMALGSDALAGAAQDILSGAVQAIRRTQLAIHTDAGIREAVLQGKLTGRSGARLSDDIANVILNGGTPEEVRRLRAAGLPNDLVELYQKLQKGQFVKAGARTFNVRAYANLVGRTMLAEATSKAAILRLQANGVEHIQISEHVQKEPDICTIFAGRVFYVGAGDDPLGFPAYRDYPQVPYHPNCAHAVMAYVLAAKSQPEIDAARKDAQLLPEEWAGASPKEVETHIHELTPAQVRAIQPRADKLLPDDYWNRAA